jgi:hypothetical protein
MPADSDGHATQQMCHPILNAELITQSSSARRRFTPHCAP